MAVQTSYSTDHAALYKGQIVDGQLLNSVSRLNKSGATIPYGQGVVSDGKGAATLPGDASTAAQFNGVVMRETNRAYADGDTFGAPDERDMTVVTLGVIAVELLDTVTLDSPVYLRVGATGRGDFSGIVGTGVTLGVLVPNAKFKSAGGAGDLVELSLTVGG